MMFQTWAQLAAQINRMSAAQQNELACAGQHPEELYPIYGFQPLREGTDLIVEHEGTRVLIERPAGTSYLSTIRTCRVCNCTELDCSGCWQRTGHPCHWVAEDLCSACVPASQAPLRIAAATE